MLDVLAGSMGKFVFHTLFPFALSIIFNRLVFGEWSSRAWNVGCSHSVRNIRVFCASLDCHYLGRVKRIWYLSPMRAAKVLARLRMRAVSPEPPLLAHTSNESSGTFRQKARSQAPLNGWACAVKIFHDGMLEDTNSLDAAHLLGVKKVCRHYSSAYNSRSYGHSTIKRNYSISRYPQCNNFYNNTVS